MVITFGNEECYSDFLIRTIAKVIGESFAKQNGMYKEIHGPINVKTELFSNMGNAFKKKASLLCLEDVSMDRLGANMVIFKYVVKANRIGLNLARDAENQSFYYGKYRYVVFPHLRLKNKTQIALDKREQFPAMSITEINLELGSKFLKEEACQTV